MGMKIALASGATDDNELFAQSAPSSSSSSIRSWSERITTSADNVTDIDKRTTVRSLSDRAAVKHLIEEVSEL